MSSHVPHLYMVPGSIHRELSADYWLGPQIGSGGYGVVRCCQNRTTGELVACKTIFKERVRLESEQSAVLREIATLRHVSGHEGIVELKGVYEDSHAVHILMEVADRGDLLEWLNKNRDPMSEKIAVDIFRQVVEAVSYCHGKGVLHRDLKPENIILFSTLNRVFSGVVSEEVEEKVQKVQVFETETGSMEKQDLWKLGSTSSFPSPPFPSPSSFSSCSEIPVLPFLEPDMVSLQFEDDSNSVFVPRAISFSLNEEFSVLSSSQSSPSSPPPASQSNSSNIIGAPKSPKNTSGLFINQSTDFEINSKFRVKVADFGLAVMSEREGRHIFAEGRAGSPSYLAPEVAEGRRYGTKADIWSLGVLLHILIFREHPFQCSKDSLNSLDSNKFVYSKELELSSGVWTKCSEELKGLVRWMLTVDSDKRPSAEEVLRHPWLSDISNDNRSFSDSLRVSVGGGEGGREGVVREGGGGGEVKSELTFSMWQSSEEQSMGGVTDLCSPMEIQSYEKENGVVDTEEVNERKPEVDKKRETVMEIVLGIGDFIEVGGLPPDCRSNDVSGYGSLFSSSDDSGGFLETEKSPKRRQRTACEKEINVLQNEMSDSRQLTMTTENCQVSETMNVTDCYTVGTTGLIEACEEILGNCDEKDGGEKDECQQALVEADETNQSNQSPCLESCPSLKRRRITSWQGSVEVNVCG